LGIFTAVKNSRKELQIPHLLIIRKKLTLYLRLITHSTLKSINLRKSLTSKVLAMTTSMANLLTMFLLIQKLIETPERWWLSDTMSKEARTVNKEPSITQWSTKIEKLPQMWPSQSLVQEWFMTFVSQKTILYFQIYQWKWDQIWWSKKANLFSTLIKKNQQDMVSWRDIVLTQIKYNGLNFQTITYFTL